MQTAEGGKSHQQANLAMDLCTTIMTGMAREASMYNGVMDVVGINDNYFAIAFKVCKGKIPYLVL